MWVCIWGPKEMAQTDCKIAKVSLFVLPFSLLICLVITLHQHCVHGFTRGVSIYVAKILA